MKKLFITLLAMMTVNILFAQSTESGNSSSSESSNAFVDNYWRLYASYNRGNLYDNSIDCNLNTYGPTVGASWGFNITRRYLPLFMEIGAEFNYRYGHENFSGIEMKMDFVDFNIPVNFVYWMPAGTLAIAPFIGLNIRHNIVGNGNRSYDIDNNGRIERKTDKVDYFCREEMGPNTAFRTQMGINLGVNFYLGDGVLVGYRFQRDTEMYMNNVCTNSHYITFGGRF